MKILTYLQTVRMLQQCFPSPCPMSQECRYHSDSGPPKTTVRLNPVGRGGALVETMTFKRRVVGSTPALAATWRPWASPLPAVACALRRETPIQYPCCSRERL